MPKKRGRKSIYDTIKPIEDISRAKAPVGLDEAAGLLWDKILRRFEPNHFNDADLILLREFVHTSETLLPGVNSALADRADAVTLRARAALVKEIASLATKLRLCVSARTRGDLASARDAGTNHRKPWETKT